MNNTNFLLNAYENTSNFLSSDFRIKNVDREISIILREMKSKSKPFYNIYDIIETYKWKEITHEYSCDENFKPTLRFFKSQTIPKAIKIIELEKLNRNVKLIIDDPLINNNYIVCVKSKDIPKDSKKSHIIIMTDLEEEYKYEDCYNEECEDGNDYITSIYFDSFEIINPLSTVRDLIREDSNPIISGDQIYVWEAIDIYDFKTAKII